MRLQRSISQGVQSIMDYKGRPSHYQSNNASLPDELNQINVEPYVRTSAEPEDWVVSLSQADLSKVCNLFNTRKAAGLDGIPGRASQSMRRTAARHRQGRF